MRLAFFPSSRKKIALPPGPRDHFPGEQLLALHRDPLGYLTRLARNYGDIAHFRAGAHHAYFFNRRQRRNGWMNGILIMATLAQRWRLQLVAGHRVELLPRSGLGSRHGMKRVCLPR